MPTSNYVGTLKINELTTAQYDAAVQSDIISDDDLSFLTDALDEQQTVMPTAEAKYEGQIVQFVGTTDASYTNGYFYKCVSDGQNPATYSWTRVDAQPAGTSYTAGTGIDITGGTISVTAPTLTNTATGLSSLSVLGTASNGAYATNIGVNSSNTGGGVSVGYSANSSGSSGICIGQQSTVASGTYSAIAIGTSTEARATNSVAIGRSTKVTAQYAIQLGAYGNSGTTNSDANTFKVGNENGNFEIMSADGTIPTARFTTDPVSDGAYIPTVTLNSGVATRSWETPTTVTFRTWGANE